LPDAICDTSAIQYLYQLDLLDVLPDPVGSITFPPAVVNELAEGRAQGVRLPTPEERGWATVQAPTSTPALPLVTDLSPGETQVLALALEEEIAENVTGCSNRIWRSRAKP
jgi:predicted nucleic acid-binding protein